MYFYINFFIEETLCDSLMGKVYEFSISLCAFFQSISFLLLYNLSMSLQASYATFLSLMKGCETCNWSFQHFPSIPRLGKLQFCLRLQASPFRRSLAQDNHSQALACSELKSVIARKCFEAHSEKLRYPHVAAVDRCGKFYLWQRQNLPQQKIELI